METSFLYPVYSLEKPGPDFWSDPKDWRTGCCTALVYVPAFRHLAGYCSAYGEARGTVIPAFALELSSHSALFYLVLPFCFNFLCSLLFFKPLHNYMLFSFFFFHFSTCIILIITAKSLKRAPFLSCRVRLFGEVVCDEWFPEPVTWWSHGTINEG